MKNRYLVPSYSAGARMVLFTGFDLASIGDRICTHTGPSFENVPVPDPSVTKFKFPCMKLWIVKDTGIYAKVLEEEKNVRNAHSGQKLVSSDIT